MKKRSALEKDFMAGIPFVPVVMVSAVMSLTIFGLGIWGFISLINWVVSK